MSSGGMRPEDVGRRIKAFAGLRKPAKPAWAEPTLDDIPNGRVIAFDQTLSRCAYVVIDRSDDGLEIKHKGTMKSKGGDKGGHADTYAKSVALLESLTFFLATFPRWGWMVVHEMPPVATKGLYRTESSLIAAVTVRQACNQLGFRVTEVAAQKARTRLAGSADRDDKKAANPFLAKIVPETATRKWNQDERDALTVGLAYLIIRREED